MAVEHRLAVARQECRRGNNRGEAMSTLEGRRVLIVGGSAGIGRAFGVEAISQGAQVVFAARREDKLKESVAEAGGGVAIAADVCQTGECDRLVRESTAALGGP